MIQFDFLNFWEQWINQFIVPTFDYVTKTLIEYDPLKTAQEYLVYVVNTNNEVIDKLSYIAWLQEQQNYLLTRLIYVVWLILLIVFVWFALGLFKTLIYMVRDSWKI